MFHHFSNLDKLVLDKCGFRGEDDTKELQIQFEILTRLVILYWTFLMIFKELTPKASTAKLVYFVMKGHAANIVFLESMPTLSRACISLPSLVPIPAIVTGSSDMGNL